MSALQRYTSSKEISSHRRAIPSLFYSSLWALHSPSEAFVVPTITKHFDHFFYESRDGNIAPIYHLPRIGRKKYSPLFILTGPFFHPQVCISSKTASILSRRQRGQDVYLLSHRGHSSSQSAHCLDHSLDAIAREDIPAALAAIRERTGVHNFQWLAQGLGGILSLIWLAQSGWSGIEKLLLINTPTVFPRHRSRLLRTTLKGLPDQLSARNVFRLLLAMNNRSGFSQQERSWLFGSSSLINIQLLEQILQWFSNGYLCSAEGDINYLKALPFCREKLFIYSSNAPNYGGHECSYPLLTATNSTWIEDNSNENFPLFSSSLARLLAHCD